MRTPFIAANWKMYKTVHEAVASSRNSAAWSRTSTDVEIVVAPPFTALHAVAEAARNSNVGVAGQNLHWEKEGAFTGEVSAAMLREAGAEYVIIGHSERRRLFHETDETVNRKTVAALGAKLTPIVCIGETLEEREGNQTLAVLDRQIKQGLDGLTGDQIGALVIAYEPVWAIGTGRNATPEQAGEAHAHIRSRHPLVVRRRGRRSLPRHLRRQRQAGQHPRADRARGRRRRARRRRQPRRAGLPRHRRAESAVGRGFAGSRVRRGVASGFSRKAVAVESIERFTRPSG